MEYDTRRCCHAGCTAEIHVSLLPANWYKSAYGFMAWVCPEHAKIWRTFNQQNQEYQTRYGEAHSAAMAEAEEKFQAEWDANNVQPVAPEYQDSLSSGSEDR